MNFTDPSKFESSMASLVDGIPKEDFHIYANILTAGTYARARQFLAFTLLLQAYLNSLKCWKIH